MSEYWCNTVILTFQSWSAADARVQAPPEIDDRHYTRITKALMLAVGSASLVLFWATTYWSVRFGWWLLSFFGSFRPHATAVFAVYLAVTFARASRPVQPLPYMPPVKDQGINGSNAVQSSQSGPKTVSGPNAGNNGSGHASFVSWALAKSAVACLQWVLLLTFVTESDGLCRDRCSVAEWKTVTLQFRTSDQYIVWAEPDWLDNVGFITERIMAIFSCGLSCSARFFHARKTETVLSHHVCMLSSRHWRHANAKTIKGENPALFCSAALYPMW